MIKLQSVVKRSTHYTMDRPQVVRREPLPRTVAVTVAPKAKHDDAQIGVQYLQLMWMLASLKTLLIPSFIVALAATYDTVPWAPSSGAFVIAIGVMTLMISFPFVNQFRTLSVNVEKEYARTSWIEQRHLKKLHRLLLIGTACAELPSMAGLLHFMMTRELISSLLLCMPAVAIMFVALRPEELRTHVLPAAK